MAHHQFQFQSQSMAPKKPVTVIEVWQNNLQYQFSFIRSAIGQFRFASLDTEFPGHIHPYPPLHNDPLTEYRYMRMNVNKTKLIQLGLTLSDGKGNLPDFGTGSYYVWEFNFREFDVDKDLYNDSSIELLKKQGIDFKRNKEMGIDSKDFAQLFLNSGFNFSYPYSTARKLTWLTFHSSYDFGYLIKIFSGKDLPDDMSKFMAYINMYFGGSVYDMKHVVKYCRGLYGGLENIAKSLHVDRVAGRRHQAGSDSLLIMQTFMKLKATYFPGFLMDCFRCKLSGLEIM